MLFDFSKLKLKERPNLMLETLSGRKLQTLGFALDITPHLAYNEVSTLEFRVPKEVDGKPVPHYEDIVGWNIIDWNGLGKFILMNPQTVYEDGYEMKSCQAYSLEYEWVFKQFVLPEGVYNFWNPVEPDDTILGMIMETVPQWTLGTVDGTLVGVYRTMDETSENLYDFVKSTLQESINCIFEFDTVNRVVNVRDVSSRSKIVPVYLSGKNLLQSIDMEEDSENIVTCVDVNGAEGVNIMSVNPTGLNKLYNLDYFMTKTHFSQQIIDKWNGWKTQCENYRQTYYDMTIERDLQQARWETENAYMMQLNADLEHLEQQQTAVISSDNSNEYKDDQLSDLNDQIAAKQAEVDEQQALLDSIQEDVDELNDQLYAINQQLLLSNVFTEEEYAQVQKYIKEDNIEETTFVYPAVKSYNTADESYELSNVACNIGPATGMPADEPGITVTKIFHPYFENKTLYSIQGGYLTAGNISANINKGSFESGQDGSFVASFYLGKGNVGDREIKSGCVSLTGTCSNLLDNTVPDPDTPQSYATGTTIQFTITDGYVYVTENLTPYQQHSVEWDLLEWGEDTLDKLAVPSYSFSIDSANFLSLDEFELFRKNLELGTKCYLELSPGKVLQPILISVKCNYSDWSDLELEFSNSFVSSDPTFSLKDLLEDAISMGKRVDYSKYTYSSWVDTGASTKVDDFISNALDAAKNNILTSTGQAITWTGNGMRFRKYNADGTGYEPEQMWAINNQLVFSDDGFDSVKTALGKIRVGDSWMYGIAAEALLGRFIAGQNLYIVSEKTDEQGNAVFKIDGDGAELHNAVFDVYNGSNTHLSINPYFGIAIGKYPVFDESEDGYVVNDENAVFWVDLEGNLHIKGTLEAADGYFNGVVRATDFQDPDGNSMLVNKDEEYKFDPDYLSLLGLTVYGPGGDVVFSVSGSGEMYFKGDIDMDGGTISWSNVNSDPLIDSAISQANSAYNKADSAEEDVLALANGTYPGGTFISGQAIYSPQLMFGNRGNYGTIEEGTGWNGKNTTNLIVIHGDNGLRIEAEGGGIALEASGDIWVGCGLSVQGGTFSVGSSGGFRVESSATFNGSVTANDQVRVYANLYASTISLPQIDDLYDYLIGLRNRISALENG